MSNVDFAGSAAFSDSGVTGLAETRNRSSQSSRVLDSDLVFARILCVSVFPGNASNTR